jgi:hypothetical protein
MVYILTLNILCCKKRKQTNKNEQTEKQTLMKERKGKTKQD